jgi:hypothetical protein
MRSIEMKQFVLATAAVALLASPAMAQNKAPVQHSTTAIDQLNLDMARHEQNKAAFEKYKADHEAWLKADEESLARRKSAVGESQTLTNEREKQNLEFKNKQQDLTRKNEGEALQRKQDADKIEPSKTEAPASK